MARPEPLRNVLIRVLAETSFNTTAVAVIPEMIRRDITFRINRGGLDPGDHTTPGIVLIANDDIEPIARSVGRIILTILSTPELLWHPVNSHREFGAWSIEAVPLTDWLRLTAHTDEQILDYFGIDPATGYPIGQEPPR